MVLSVKPDGSFQANDLPEDNYWIWVCDTDNTTIAEMKISVEKNKTTQVVVPLMMNPAGTSSLEVTLVDSAGAPMADREVVLVNKQKVETTRLTKVFGYESAELSAKTDAQGKCLFEHLPAASLVVAVKTTQYKSGNPQLNYGLTEVNPKAGQRTAIRTVGPPFLLVCTASIEGKILQQGKWQLQLSGVPVGGYDWINIFGSNKDGVFKLERLPAGRYQISVCKSDSSFKSAPIMEIELKEGEQKKGIELNAPPKFRQIAGKCVGYRYNGGGDYVMFENDCQCRMMIRPDGTFEGSVPPGKYKVYRTPFLDRATVKTTEITIEDKEGVQNIELR